MTKQRGAAANDTLVIEETTNFDGFEVSYNYSIVDGSETPPLVLLGGAFQTARSWAPFNAVFANRKPVLSIELPGSPGSPPLPRDSDFSWLAACVIHVLDELRIDQVDVLAFSYAGPIGFYVGSQYPRRVRRLTLGGTTGAFTAAVEQTVRLSVEYAAQGEREYFASLSIGVGLTNINPKIKIRRQQAITRMLWRQLTTLTDQDVENYIENSMRILAASETFASRPRPQCFTLGFTGQYDTLTPPGDSQDFILSFPNAVFTTVLATDHLCLFEDPRTTVALADTFFTDQTPKQLPDCTPYRYSIPQPVT